MARLARITVYRLQIPLKTPYVLALGVVRAFDTILVEAQDHDGRWGLGEATLLTGYTEETVGASWQLARELARAMAGKEPAAAREVLSQAGERAPFTVTALATALEMIEGHPILKVDQATRVPVLGLIHGSHSRELEGEIDALLEQGYRTFKVKVGFDVEADLERVGLIQRACAGRATIRLDANQGYTREQACRFAARLDPQGIELFEQPCKAGDWDAACAAARVSAVPMMLDESIYGLRDIERAAELKAARYIKLKLMKMGGLERLTEAIKRIRDCGMEPVLGNGVAGEVGCWMEACAARQLITNAGEMNGFLKPVAPLLAHPLRFEEGAIVLESGFQPSLDPAAVSRFAVEAETFS